jgi:acyl-CoA thioester hydrolase
MFDLEVRVDYVDTDAMAIVHHASYCRWLERARVEWLRLQGHDYKAMERDGFSLPLRELKLTYHKPLRFDDRASVHLFVRELGRASVELGYRITELVSGELCTEASTLHVFVRREEQAEGGPRYRTTSFPKEWREKWQLLKEKKSSTSL